MKTIITTPQILKLFLSFIAGLLYASSFPHTHLPFPFLLGTILGLSLWLRQTSLFYPNTRLGFDFLTLFMFNIGYNLLGYFWIIETVEIFGGIQFPWNFLIWLSFTLIITPHFLFFLLIGHGLKSRLPKLFHFLPAMALLFALLEYFIPQQFPAHIYHPWISMAPYLGLAPWIGGVGFTFFLVWISLEIYHLFLLKRKPSKNKIIALTSLTFIFILLNITLKLQAPDLVATRPLGLRMVQANVGNFMKASSERGSVWAVQEVYNRFKNLSLATQQSPELIIWPETSIPDILTDAKSFGLQTSLPWVVGTVMKDYQERLGPKGPYLFYGGYDENQKYDQFNAGILVNPEGRLQQIYHKIKLIPFGEGLPFGERINEWVKPFAKGVSFFGQGKEFTLFKTPRANFIPLICYEVLFPEFIRDSLNSHPHEPIHFMANLTNDSWFGKTSEPWQHLELTKWRPLEFQKTLVRATNTGVSVVLYPDGSTSRHTQLYQQENLDVLLPLESRPATFFQRYGIGGVLLLFTMISLLLFIFAEGLAQLNREGE